eukprot:6484858-Amphidinium_carterae.1
MLAPQEPEPENPLLVHVGTQTESLPAEFTLNYRNVHIYAPQRVYVILASLAGVVCADCSLVAPTVPAVISCADSKVRQVVTCLKAPLRPTCLNIGDTVELSRGLAHMEKQSPQKEASFRLLQRAWVIALPLAEDEEGGAAEGAPICYCQVLVVVMRWAAARFGAAPVQAIIAVPAEATLEYLDLLQAPVYMPESEEAEGDAS